MIIEKINQIEKLISVPNVDKDPDGANNAMQMLIHLTELRGLVDSAFLPPVSDFYLLKEGDIIKEGDEFSNGDVWAKTGVINATYNVNDFKPHRRRITKASVKTKDHESLSAGICDTCNVPKMVNSGDGRNEPLDPVLYCEKMNTVIEPEPPEDRRTECEFYACRR